MYNFLLLLIYILNKAINLKLQLLCLTTNKAHGSKYQYASKKFSFKYIYNIIIFTHLKQ